MAIDKMVSVTPTENLVLELLIARYRLGERLWTFDSNVKQQVESLSKKGYVMPLNGVTEKTVRAMLTDEAIALYLTYDYMPPIAQDNPVMMPFFRQITDNALDIKARLESENQSASV